MNIAKRSASDQDEASASKRVRSIRCINPEQMLGVCMFYSNIPIELIVISQKYLNGPIPKKSLADAVLTTYGHVFLQRERQLLRYGPVDVFEKFLDPHEDQENM